MFGIHSWIKDSKIPSLMQALIRYGKGRYLGPMPEMSIFKIWDRTLGPAFHETLQVILLPESGDLYTLKTCSEVLWLGAHGNSPSFSFFFNLLVFFPQWGLWGQVWDTKSKGKNLRQTEAELYEERTFSKVFWDQLCRGDLAQLCASWQALKMKMNATEGHGVKGDLVPRPATELLATACDLLGPNMESFWIISKTTPLTLSGSLESFLCHLAMPPLS